MSVLADTPETSQPAKDVHWRSWLVAKRPQIAVCAGIGLPGVTALVAYATGSVAMACLALAAVLLAGWRAGVPIEFTVDDGGVKQRWLQRRHYDDWSAFRAFSTLPRGFMLWRTSHPCPLDAMDGLFLPCPPQKDELRAILHRHLTEIA